MESVHYPVMLSESVGALSIDPDGVYADLTAGGGSHSFEIAKRLRGGKLICVDRDGEAVDFVRKRLCGFADRIFFINDNYSNIKKTEAETVSETEIPFNCNDPEIKNISQGILSAKSYTAR